MSARRWTYFVLAPLLIALAVSLGCNRTRSDAQIAGEVNQKIMGDANLQTKQIGITANNGVVTLSGDVGSEMERTAAANDAATVDGVRTVVNNLTVAQAPAPPPPVQQEPPQQAAAPARKPSPRRMASSHPYQAPAAPQAAPVAQAVSTPVAVAQTAPPPPPPKPVTIEPGTMLSIRMIDSIDSDRNQIGDRFRATLDTPISVNDQTVLPAGADVEGRVAQLRSAGHFTGQSEIALELTSISVNGRRYNLQTDQYSRQGSSRGKNTAAKVGTGAAVGAIIGAIAGGGKGAAIGATVGAGAGGGVQAATKAQQIHITSEQLLTFKLESPLTVTPQASARRSVRTISDNYSDDQSYSQPQPADDQPVLKRRPQ